MSLDDVLTRAADRGVDVDRLVVSHEPGVVPPAPSDVWVVVPMQSGGTVIGGMDRGQFAPYAEFTNDEGAADALAQLSTIPVAPPPPAPMKAMLHATQALADQLRAGLRDETRLPGSAVPVGAVFDHIGAESGHVLYLLNTPFGQRSLPPTYLNEPRTGYVLEGPLPENAVVSALPAWFGQPGGGLVVALPQVIRCYADTGLLSRFDPTTIEDATGTS